MACDFPTQQLCRTALARLVPLNVLASCRIWSPRSTSRRQAVRPCCRSESASSRCAHRRLQGLYCQCMAKFSVRCNKQLPGGWVLTAPPRGQVAQEGAATIIASSSLQVATWMLRLLLLCTRQNPNWMPSRPLFGWHPVWIPASSLDSGRNPVWILASSLDSGPWTPDGAHSTKTLSRLGEARLFQI